MKILPITSSWGSNQFKINEDRLIGNRYNSLYNSVYYASPVLWLNPNELLNGNSTNLLMKFHGVAVKIPLVNMK